MLGISPTHISPGRRTGGKNWSSYWTPQIPTMVEGTPAKGKVTKRNITGWNNNVYYTIYLPSNYSATGTKNPVIFDLPPNEYETYNGKPECEYLGYGLGYGSDFIVVVAPFLNADGSNLATTYWGAGTLAGDYTKTLEFWQAILTDIETNFNSDPDRVILTGFSRGAVACSYLGCSTYEWASKFCAFMPFSHHDGGSLTPFAAYQRLMRMQPMKTAIMYGGVTDSGRANSLIGVGICNELEIDYTAFEIADSGHDIAWCLREDDAIVDSIRAFLDTYKNGAGFIHTTHIDNTIEFSQLLGCSQSNGTLTATAATCGAIGVKKLPQGVDGFLMYSTRSTDNSKHFGFGFHYNNDAPTGGWNDITRTGVMWHGNGTYYQIPLAQNLNFTPGQNSVTRIKRVDTTVTIEYAADGYTFENKFTFTSNDNDIDFYIRVTSDASASSGNSTLDSCVCSNGFEDIV